ncbi:MAG: hypothetical protein NT077_04210 [Candidatus Taylorbacteria bacterium]|nr:hypothetical protein [Candidatus Taylorbacteria bacterium]
MRYYVAALLIVVIFIMPWFGMNFPDVATEILATIRSAGEQIAAVILMRKPVTVEQLKSNYMMASIPGQEKVRILVVPGHEPDFGGTEFGSLDERVD